MVVGKEDDEVKSSMGNMPSLLHEEDEDLPSPSTSPTPPQPASGLNDSQPEGTPINAQGIENFEAEAVDDANNRKSEPGEEEEEHQKDGGEQTLRAAESNELPVDIESQLPAAGDKEDRNESEEVVEEHQQPHSVDEVSELPVHSVSVLGALREDDDGKSNCAEKMEEDRGDERNLDDLHVVNEVDDSRLNKNEGMEDGVEVEGEEDSQKEGESSKDPNLDNAVEQKEEIEKQDDTLDEIDTVREDEYGGDKRDEAGADMEDENDANRDKVEGRMENVNDNNRGEVEADRDHEKDEDVGQFDEKCETVADVSMLVSESESDKIDGDVNAPALDAMAGVSKLENIVEEEKKGDVSMALADSGLASNSDVVRKEEKGEVMNVVETVSDDTALAHKSDVIEAEKNDTGVAAPVVCDSAQVRESSDTKKEEKDDSTPGNESKVDEEKDEDMSAQARKLPRSDPEPEKSEVGGESELVIVKDDFDHEEMEEEEGEGTPVVDKGMDIEAEAAGGSSSGKRKRGRGAGAVGRASTKKKMEEDVCFICFDGGDLVLCDRR